MTSVNKKAYFKHSVFEVSSEVYQPSEDSFLFAENLRVKKGSYVLDMGTGSGILGILAAETADAVLAVDINPSAVLCAKQNAALNRMNRKMSFLRGDLFTSLVPSMKFNLIIFNAPYLPTEENGEKPWLECAWSGGITGREVIDRFISQAPQHLSKNGEILLMQSSLANIQETKENLTCFGLKTETVAVLNFPFFETLFLLRATPFQ